MRFKVSDILEACVALDARLLSGSLARVMSGVTTDSRDVSPGQMFVALEGENFDGHLYVDQALEAGATGALVRSGWRPGDLTPSGRSIIEVSDTLEGLGCLARWWRMGHRLDVLAVTGSIGKTSVKEMTAAIVGQRLQTMKTRGNLNNLIGLPLTLFEIQADTRAAVVELGINQPGEMERLTDISRPTIGLIINLAEVHLEYLGDMDGVARAKTALWRGMRGGTAVVNADDRRLVAAAGATDLYRLTFGRAAGSDVRLIKARGLGLDGLAVELEIQGQRAEMEIPLLGAFYGPNVAAACATALAVGCDVNDMTAGLTRVSLPGHRMRLVHTPACLRILDDAYNANPQAVVAALETLVELKPNGGRTGAVLGQMAEMGGQAEAGHRRVGRRAAEIGLDVLIALGPWAGLMAAEAQKAGCARALVAADAAEAAGLAARELGSGDALLVKGSRVAALERVVDLLEQGD